MSRVSLIRQAGLAILLTSSLPSPAAGQPANVTLTIELAGPSNGTVGVVPGGLLCSRPASTSCAVSMTPGTAVTLLANAPANSNPPGVFSAGTGSASACGKSTCAFTITMDSQVRATFSTALGPFITITATFAGDGQGEVGIDNSKRQNYDPLLSAGSGTRYASGSVVSMGAAPAPESRFSGFSAGTNGAAVCGASASCSFTANSDASVTATFHGLTALAVAPSSASVSVGNAQVFSASGTYSNGVTEAIVTSGTGTWRTRAQMPTARATLGAAVVNGLIYAIGGGGSSAPVATVERYDPAANTWSSRASMTNAREGLGVAVVNDQIYAVGGNAPGSTMVSVVERYDPGTNTWTPRAPLAAPRRFLAAVSANGIVYAIGGETAAGTVNTVEAYNPATDTWSTKAPMKTARKYFAAVEIDGLIYALGGDGGAFTVEAYNPATDTWMSKAAMPGSRGALAAAVVDGVIYAFAGDNAGGTVTTIAYDAARDQWGLKTSVPTARAEFASATAGGIVYVIGGRSPSGALFRTVQALTDVARWRSSDVAVAAVNQQGSAVALVPGQADILATIGGFTCATGGACGKLTASCSYAIAPASVTIGGPGGSGAVSVTAGPGCAWTAASNSSFVSVTAGASGSGNGTVAYAVAAATGAQRVGTLTIAGSTFTVTQDPSCSYALDRTGSSVPAAGGSLNVSVTAQAGCGWSASSTSSFVTVTSGATGTGNGTVSLSVLTNTVPSSRSAQVTIAGLTFTITQDASCTYVLDRSGATVGPGGGPVNVAVSAASGCPWTASTSSTFVTVTSGATGTGNGTVSLTVLPNPVVGSRSADVTIAGLNFTITQDPSCNYGLDRTSATVTSAGGALDVSVSAQPGCAWTASTAAAFVAIPTGASGTGSGTVTLSILQNTQGPSRTAEVTIAGLIFTIVQAGVPTMALDRAALAFAATTNGIGFTSQTGGQAVRLIQTGEGPVTWTVSSNVSWLDVTPASGSGSATLTVSVRFLGGLAASQSGRISVVYSGAASAPGTVDVTLTTSTVSAGPTGAFDTPLEGSTGVTGSIAVTGWAIDDVDVTRVRILRDPVAPEPAGSLVFLGDAVLVDGARPDVQAGFPNAPRNSRAGWGYLLLTNFLPGLGTGTYTLYAIADDADGHSATLGSKTITCTNSTATAPFGAIDTPAQGETVSGTINNFGWVLSPGLRRSDPPSGGAVRVVIDGVLGATPGGWVSRADLAALFPLAQFSGVDSALGVASIDTTPLTNGVHTISWLVTDNMGAASGVGSRYFTVSNGAAVSAGAFRLTASAEASAVKKAEATGAPAEAPSLLWLPPSAFADASADRRSLGGGWSGGSLRGRRGYDLEAPYRSYAPDADGRITIASEELDRIELQLDPAAGETYAGYLRVGEALRPLPIGSTLNAETGVFTWSPGVGFVGSYDLVFVRSAGGQAFLRHEVRIVLQPKGAR